MPSCETQVLREGFLKAIEMQLTKNFNKSEFDSKDGAPMPAHILENVRNTAKNLQVLRDYLGKPVHITSGYRSPSHNADEGGAKNSQHLKGTAADIYVPGMTPYQLAQVIEKLIKAGKMDQGGLSVYPSMGFVHYDTRGWRARW